MFKPEKQNKFKIYDSTQQQAYLGLDYVNENINECDNDALEISMVLGHLSETELFKEAKELIWLK